MAPASPANCHDPAAFRHQAEFVDAPERSFANWWIGAANRNGIGIAKIGLSRELAAPAAA